MPFRQDGMSMTSAVPPRPVEVSVEASVEARAEGFLVAVQGRPVRTPRGNPVVVPTAALARAIAAEIAAAPGILAGKGLNDPAAAPCFRIAAGAIDVVAEPDDRAAVEAELLGYAGTDLVCIRAGQPAELVAREDAVWGPLCRWFGERHGVVLALGTGVLAAPQPDAVRLKLGAVLAQMDAFRLAALSLATRSAGSIVIALALCEGWIDADRAFAAATLEETFQEEIWGADAEAARSRAVKRLDLGQAARFVALLSED